MTTVKLRPPFQYVAPNALLTPGILSCNDTITDKVVLRNGPTIHVVDEHRNGDLGIFVLGAPGRETWVTLSGLHGQVGLQASNNAGKTKIWNLTQRASVRMPEYPVVGAAHLDALYIGGLGRVFKVDLFSLDCESVTFEPGYESIVEPYVNTPLVSTLGLCKHGGRFVYWFRESIEVHLTVEPVGAQLENGNRERLLGGARMRLWPSDILYSDPLRPTACKWSSVWSTSGMYGGDVMACVSVEEGLLVLTTTGAWLLKGDDLAEAVAVYLSEWADCCAPRSVVRLQGATIWVGRRAVWAYIPGQGVQMLDNLTFALERCRVSDRRRIAGLVFGGGRYLMYYAGLDTAVVMELATGLPCSVTTLGGVNISAFPIAQTGIGTVDEIAVGTPNGLKILVFGQRGQSSDVLFSIPDLDGVVKTARFIFDDVPDEVSFVLAPTTALIRTDRDLKMPPEDQTVGHFIWVWPKRKVDSEQEVFVERHSLFDRERFQINKPAQQDSLVRWSGGAAFVVEGKVGKRIPRGEILLLGVKFRGAGLLGVDLEVTERGQE